VRDLQDADAWRELVALYGPLVYQFARKRGLQDADAADLTQIVFQELTRAVPRLDYDRRRGTFRGWLLAVVRNQLHNLARRKQTPPGTGDTGVQDLLEQQPERESDEAALWEEEYQRRRFEWAAERVRPGFAESTWQAFWQTAVEGRSAREAAEVLGMTVGAVYTAKSRVLDRVRQEIQQLQDEAESPSEG
jgi:RNA polymerase sigma-70 factor (ECF subfamily)